MRRIRKIMTADQMRRAAAAAALASVLLVTGCAGTSTQPQNRSIRIGLSLYDQYDTFITELMERYGAYVEKRKAGGADIVTVTRDAAGSQAAQNDQVREFIESGCKVVCVNLVDRTAPTDIIDMARNNDVPVIFFNRELVEEDLMQWDRLYYVGADAFQSGILQGEMAAEYYLAHPQVDRNGDGSIQYVILEGEIGHQDAIIRTEYSVDTMIQKGVLMDKVGYGVANWSRAQARTKMQQLLDLDGSEIELVLANNDDMALGAIEAYEDKEIPRDRWPMIFGIDGTEVGLQAVVDGRMTGTVYNDKDGQAKAMEELAYALASGKSLDELSLPDSVSLQDNKYIRLPYAKVDQLRAKELLGE